MNSIADQDRLSFIQRVFIFLVVITSGTPLTQDFSFPNILLVLTFVLLLLRREVIINNSTGRFGLVLMFLILVWILQFFSCPNNLSFSLIFKYSLIIFCTIQFCTNTRTSSKSKIDFFVRIILITSLISNILFLASVFGVPIPTIESSSHTIPTFYYLGAAAYTEEYGFLGYRNCGIFWEPGLYQIYLNFALIYFLYSPKLFYKNKWLVVFYLIFSVYTTGSTTGLFLCAFIIGYYMIFNSKMNNAMKFIVITVAIVLSGGVIYSYLLLNLTTKMDSASYLARMTDLTFGFEVFKEKPFLGYGIANDIYTAKFSAMFGIERGDSNGLMNLLISFGLIGLVVYVISLYRFAKSCVSIFADRVILLVLLWAIVSLCTEPISTHATVFFFMGIGLGNRIYNCKEHITHEHRISDIGLNKYSGFIDNFQVND